MAVTARELRALDVCRPSAVLKHEQPVFGFARSLDRSFTRFCTTRTCRRRSPSPLGCERGRSTFQCPGLTSATRRPLSYGVG